MTKLNPRQSIQPGDWVTVKPEHDIPPAIREGKPTRGRVEQTDRPSGLIIVSVPIGDADVDEHSQSVPYPPEALIPESRV